MTGVYTESLERLQRMRKNHWSSGYASGYADALLAIKDMLSADDLDAASRTIMRHESCCCGDCLDMRAK